MLDEKVQIVKAGNMPKEKRNKRRKKEKEGRAIDWKGGKKTKMQVQTDSHTNK